MRIYLLLLFYLFFSIINCSAQTLVTVSGIVKNTATKKPLPFVNMVLATAKDSVFVSGTITNENGRFSLTKIQPGNYTLTISSLGFATKKQSLFVGTLSEYLDIKPIELTENLVELNEVTVTSRTGNAVDKMDKKTFSVASNLTQTGGSVLQALQNLPGVTVQDGKVQLRGSDKITVLIDGKQTALTGFGSQTGLDNIPASAIEKIEIVNNPSAKYEANGSAGIINIVYKKNQQNGLHGKVALTTGLGSLWVRQTNLPTITPQYTSTPKINPHASLNYKHNRFNVFFQGDYLYTETLNKNEFVTRTYQTDDTIRSQLKRNRNTHFTTFKSGVDVTLNQHNTLTISALFGSEKIIDRGDQPFFDAQLVQRKRLWQFLEDELKTTIMTTANYSHHFQQAGHLLKMGVNYTFHREDEKYFYNNYLPATNGTDAFKLLSDERVYDATIDYTKPLTYGRLELGLKYRSRNIPTNMQFLPGTNSVIDANAGGAATYQERIPAIYGNYLFENNRWEAELGLRIEKVTIRYYVQPNHPVYKSDGYEYTQPFPNMRLAYKINQHNKLTLLYTRRVDRPNEVDIRIFPKYDDAEIIKVGNPALQPQFTHSFELGHKSSWTKGSLYSALYHKIANGTITRIAGTVPPSNLIYAVFQNVNQSYLTGIEMVWAQKMSASYAFNFNLNAYQNTIAAFSVENKYPSTHTYTATEQHFISGNIKFNHFLQLSKQINTQLSLIYLAPDIIPQGSIQSRFSLDIGLKKSIQHGKGEIVANATDLFNTLMIKKQINGQGFRYTSSDYAETQVIRVGYHYKW